MDSAQVLNNYETPIQCTADIQSTQYRVLSKSNAAKENENTEKTDFKKQLKDCENADVGKQPIFQIVDYISGSETKSDNSMHSDSHLANSLPGIVGTLEGFGLLDYQADKNGSVISEELLSILDNVVIQTEGMQTVGNALQEVLIKGMVNDGEQGTQLSEQFAGMRPNEPLNSLQDLTQQEILQRIGTYLCSLESTNNDSSYQTADFVINNQMEAQTALIHDGDIAFNRLTMNEPIAVKDSEISAKTMTNTDKADGLLPKEKPIFHETGIEATIAENDLPTTVINDGKEQQAIGSEKQAQEITELAKENVIRIVDKVSTHASEGRHDFDIKLKPEFLGKLNIKLVMENGSIKIQIKTQDADVKGLVSDQLPQLQSILKDKEIIVSNIDVFCESQTFEQNEQQAFDQNSGNGNGKRGWKNNLSVDMLNDSNVQNMITDLTELYHQTCSVEFRA